MPRPPAGGRVAVTIESLLELKRTVEEVMPDTTRAREAVLRNRSKGDRQGRRVRQLLGERKPCLCAPSALSVVPSELRQPRELAEVFTCCRDSRPGSASARRKRLTATGKPSVIPRAPASRLRASARTRPGCEEATAPSSRTAAFFISPAYWQCSAALMRRRLMLSSASGGVSAIARSDRSAAA